MRRRRLILLLALLPVALGTATLAWVWNASAPPSAETVHMLAFDESGEPFTPQPVRSMRNIDTLETLLAPPLDSAPDEREPGSDEPRQPQGVPTPASAQASQGAGAGAPMPVAQIGPGSPSTQSASPGHWRRTRLHLASLGSPGGGSRDAIGDPSTNEPGAPPADPSAGGDSSDSTAPGSARGGVKQPPQSNNPSDGHPNGDPVVPSDDENQGGAGPGAEPDDPPSGEGDAQNPPTSGDGGHAGSGEGDQKGGDGDQVTWPDPDDYWPLPPLDEQHPPVSVPEPGTLGLLALGLIGCMLRARRTKPS